MKKIIYIFLLFVFFFYEGNGYAQGKRKPKKKKKEYTTLHNGQQQIFNIPPYHLYRTQKNIHKKTKKKKSKPTLAPLSNDYTVYRMLKRKNDERKYDKPQFKDPLYFGHKKKPKKRKVGKRKFCKECGIVH